MRAVLIGLLSLCVSLLVGDLLLAAVRRTHRATLARHGVAGGPAHQTQHRRERGHGAINSYVVLGDELLVEIDVRGSRPGRPMSSWARGDASVRTGAALQRWRDDNVRIDIQDHDGFLTLRAGDEIVQLFGLSPQQVTTS